ncbi:MAG: helix-turn-helix domain-containing protein [Janthinobacterium lividum]
MPYQTTASHIPSSRVSATYRIALPGYETSWHEHEEFMFLLPDRGTLTVSVDSSDAQRVGCGLLAVVAPGRLHKTTSSEGEHGHTAIYVEREFVAFCAKKADVRLASGDAPRYVSPTPTLLGALHLQRLLQFMPSRSEHEDYQLGLLERLVASACVESALGAFDAPRGPGARKRTVEAIKSFLDATLSARINLDAIALEFNMSRRNLTRSFREETGQSITEYQTSRRVKQAAALLQIPGTTVLDAALQVGIDSPSYLARLFRKRGLSVPHSLKA